jgi:hypothetical protein
MLRRVLRIKEQNMSEREISRTTKLAILTPIQARPFQTICRKVKEETGSDRKTCEALDISNSTYAKLMNECYLTAKQAAKILAKRKAMKAAQSAI